MNNNKNIFYVNKPEEIYKIPYDTEILYVNTLIVDWRNYDKDNKYKYSFTNLPVILEEIHFNDDDYYFEKVYDDNIYSIISFLSGPKKYLEYPIKLPFNCEVYKFEKKINNFNDKIFIELVYRPSGTWSMSRIEKISLYL